MKIYPPVEITSPFDFGQGLELMEFPLAPLVNSFEVVVDNVKHLFVRAIIFVPEGSSSPMFTEITQDGELLNLYAGYMGNGIQVPDAFVAYQLSYQTLQTSEPPMKSVQVFAHNEDPRTSRGTTTIVQKA